MTDKLEMTEAEARELLIQTYYNIYVEPYGDDSDGSQSLEDVSERFDENPVDVINPIDTHFGMEIFKANYALQNPNAAGDMWRTIPDEERPNVPEQFLKSTHEVLQFEKQRLEYATEMRQKITVAAQTLSIEFTPYDNLKPILQ